jgi:hypothetical protein
MTKTGRRTHGVPPLKQDLKEFAEGLVCHDPKDQGFFARTAVRQILSP